jgi:hypothetical protein
MKKLSILLLLAAVGMSGCFWGFRGRGRGEGPNRGGEYRGHDEGRGHYDHGGEHDRH